MSKAALVVMAAGIGSRFGGGIKQLEPVGPSGEIIMDYSIYDAMKAGFDKVVFVIRRDLEEDFKSVIGNRIAQQVETVYAYQEVTDIPFKYKEKFGDRTKPWGTGQAVLCCKEVLQEPFLVINADDYYGREAYCEAYAYLTRQPEKKDVLQACMIGFVLKNTLSKFGAVTRGICKVDENRMLTDIVETHHIEQTEEGAGVLEAGSIKVLDVNAEVSMNMWGFSPQFFEVLTSGFEAFLEQTDAADGKAEYLLPTIVGELLKEGNIQVKVLQSADKWFGVTYKEDKAAVQEAIQALIVQGIYENKLFDS